MSLVARGELALPDFQRRFVWDPGQVSDLLDSVANGWPIGSLLLLEGPQPFGIEPIQDGPRVARDKVRYYLLDGQQRVTSLFHALTDTSDTVYYLDPRALERGEELEIKSMRRDRFAKAALNSGLIKIADLLEPEAVLSRGGQPVQRSLLDRVQGLTRVGYQVPAIVMGSDIELEALTRIFETLNRTGERLNAFDLMVAVLRPSDFFLRDRWSAAQVEFPILEDFEVDGVEILKLIALDQRDLDRTELDRPSSRRVTGIKQRDVLNTPAETVIRRWDAAVAAYARALRFLSDAGGVRDSASMPSWAMVLTIARFLDHSVPPRALERWYWGAIVSQTYAQGANTQVLTDIDFGLDEELVWDLDENVDVDAHLRLKFSEPARRNRILRFGLRGALVRAGARDAVNGTALESPIVEFSVQKAMQNEFRTALDVPIADLALANRRSLAERKLDEAGLESQGFLDPFAPPQQRLNQRVATFVELLEGWL